jgi:hypothetical protein
MIILGHEPDFLASFSMLEKKFMNFHKVLITASLGIANVLNVLIVYTLEAVLRNN